MGSEVRQHNVVQSKGDVFGFQYLAIATQHIIRITIPLTSSNRVEFL